ncbi:hypothetical protein ElyMa_000998200 [Elysia marginata]|uniref:Snake toxin/toxin-like domain-containing protein n=1 Tax=Elysia marginata TaxID=1093978 RepID=A0AAV4HII7_9GAST|nr:hypothetical protein ElyMa_000998200 [Elysia marginata]
MKIAFVLLAVCVAYAASAPRDKRALLVNFAEEAGKILICEGKKTEEDCMKCCHETTWLISAEESACTVACNILPNAASWSTTYPPANLLNPDAANGN